MCVRGHEGGCKKSWGRGGGKGLDATQQVSFIKLSSIEVIFLYLDKPHKLEMLQKKRVLPCREA